MEPSKEATHFYIFTRYRLGLRARSVHEELVKHKKLGRCKKCARWVSHQLTALQKEQKAAHSCTQNWNHCDVAVILGKVAERFDPPAYVVKTDGAQRD